MPFRTRCPECGRYQQWPDDARGDEVSCRNCGDVYVADDGRTRRAWLIIGGACGLLLAGLVAVAILFTARQDRAEVQRAEAEAERAAVARPKAGLPPAPKKAAPDAPGPDERPAIPRPPVADPPPGPPAASGTSLQPTVRVPLPKGFDPRIGHGFSRPRVRYSGTPDGHVALIGVPDDTSKRFTDMPVSVADLKTGAVRGRLLLPMASLVPLYTGHAVSPGGKWVAVSFLELKKGTPDRPFGNVETQVRLWRVDDPNAAPLSFIPLPDRNEVGVEVKWAALLADDRLLTLYADGRFDVWSVPDLKRVASQIRSIGNVRVDRDAFTLSSGALAPDGKTLGLFSANAFYLIDTTTGQRRAIDWPVPDDGRAEFNGTAFSADGKRVAAVWEGDKGTWLDVIDVPSGKVQRWKQPDKMLPSGVAWWGPNHVLVNEDEGSKHWVVDARTGETTAVLRPEPQSGLFAIGGPNDRLWFAGLPPGAAPLLVAFDPPGDFFKGKEGRNWRVTADRLGAPGFDLLFPHIPKK